MTKKELMSYRNLLKEIRKTEEDMEKLLKRQEKLPTVKDKVQASGKEFPYVPTHVTVDAPDPLRNSTIEQLLVRKRRMLARLQKERMAIEDYVQAIPDSRTRMIFSSVFIDGKTQRYVSVILGYDESVISRSIDRYLGED